MKSSRLLIALTTLCGLVTPALAGLTATPQLYVTPTSVKYGQNVGIYSTITSTVGSPAGSVDVKSDGSTLASRTLVSYPVTAISAGTGHTCAIQDGGLKCWGDNASGQLGDGSTTPSTAPVAVSSMSSGVKAVAAGSNFTCAIQDDSALCWGDNSKGQLGTGDFVNSPSPVAVTGLETGVTAIAAGPESACAIQNGALKCWGRNHMKQLGNNSSANAGAPVAVHNMTSGVTAVAISLGHACAIKSGAASGAAYCWGDNATGQLGDTTNTQRGEPVAVSGLSSGVQLIGTGLNHSCAVLASGVKCWGLNSNGQLGDNTNTTSNTPVSVAFLSTGVTRLTLGEFHTCAIANSAVGCWGYGGDGEFGNGSTGSSNIPSASSLDSTYSVSDIESGTAHVCALVASGAAHCWGKNVSGQLGDGTTSQQNSPVVVDHLQKDSIDNYATTGLSVGTHLISISYNGNSAFDAANSADISVTVAKADTALSVTSSDLTAMAGQSVTFEASISVTSPGAGIPTGQVTFKDGTTTIGTGSLSGGKASISLTSLTVGSHSITATYAGDTSFAASFASALDQQVDKLAVTTLAVADHSTLLPLSTLTVDVTLSTSTGLLPSGTVSLVEDGHTLATATLSAGKASLSLSSLTIGDHGLLVQYAGGDNFLAGSASLTVTVSPLSGANVKISTYSKGDQSHPTIAALTKGGTINVWTSANQDGAGLGVYARIYKADGTPLGKEFRVNTTTAGDQTTPAVAALSSGDVVVVWLNKGTGLKAQLLDKTGKKKGVEFTIDATNGLKQNGPAVAAHGKGGFAVTWSTTAVTGAKSAIIARFFDKNGQPLGTSLRVDSLKTGIATSPAIASLKNGAVAICWVEAASAGKPGKILLRGYASTSKALGPAVVASVSSKTVKATPVLTSLSSGAIALTWAAKGQDGSGWGVYGRLFKSVTGARLTAEFAIPSVTAGDQADPAIVAYTKGGFMVAWTSNDGSARGIYARRFTASGKSADLPVRVNGLTSGEQIEPALAATSDRTAMILWSSAGLDGSGLAIAGQQLKLGAAAADRR